MTTKAKTEVDNKEEEKPEKKKMINNPKGAINFRVGVDAATLRKMTEDFVANDMSTLQVAKKYNRTQKYVADLGRRFKWMRKRKKFIEKMVEWTIDVTAKRYQNISSEVSKVFVKQVEYIKRRLALVEDGQKVPEDLMKEAIRLHDLIQKDITKVDRFGITGAPGQVEVSFGNMPSVVDLLNYKPPENQGPPVEKKLEPINKDLPAIDVPKDPVGNE